EKKLCSLQTELIKLQSWVIEQEKKVVIIFEGRDAAGKGGAIRRTTQRMNPRHIKIVALNVPSSDEKKQWFFQRYINQLPKPGEMVFFDRSWYNRAGVEPVNGFCTQIEYDRFMGQVNAFEKMLLESETYLIKIYFSITKEEQFNRFEAIKKNPLKKWKITPVDQNAQALWDDYTRYKELMFEKTNTPEAPWEIIDANRKTEARLKTIDYILGQIPYQEK
ncbi:MAG: polyphosphate kinase 2, partial [Flavobacteriaceae bacterium]